jgi:hypothetical protein
MASDREERNKVLGVPRGTDPNARTGNEQQRILGMPADWYGPPTGICSGQSGIPSRRTGTGCCAGGWAPSRRKKVTRRREADPARPG